MYYIQETLNSLFHTHVDPAHTLTLHVEYTPMTTNIHTVIVIKYTFQKQVHNTMLANQSKCMYLLSNGE